jgi:O-methyltransferase
MSSYSQKARNAARRLRRRLAGSREAELEAELRATKRKLRKARAELERARAGLPPHVEETIARARAEHLTYLKPANLRELAAVVVELERAQRPGLIVEAGTARGGSAIVLAAAKAAARPMKVYDVFGMIPPPTERDGADVHQRYEAIAGGRAKGVGGETYYGYRDDLYGEVTGSFARLGVPADEHNVKLIQGLFEDTIDLDQPVALAHLDGDWYESTMTCLERIAPLLVPGGRIVLDDYYKWSGCRAAVDEYFADRDGFRLERRSRLHVVRD